MSRISQRLLFWLDNERQIPRIDQTRHDPDWLRIVPFLFLHLAVLLVFWTGVSAVAVWIAVFSFWLRMFAITGFYHRYFAHRTFRASRPVQFFFALLGTAATQRGPLWWAAHHRHHHRHADQPQDLHSPREGFWHSHCGWFLGGSSFATRTALIRDFCKFPELLWLDRFDIVIPVIYALLMFSLGEWIGTHWPETGTDGLQILVWGYFISTVVLLHATLSINSLAHRFGSRRYETQDDSRNSWWLALLTMGEGWHNNHHHYAGSVRQGFFWWEIDLTFYMLWMLERVGLVSDLRPVPLERRDQHLALRTPPDSRIRRGTSRTDS